jgi:hypothetical protein
LQPVSWVQHRVLLGCAGSIQSPARRAGQAASHESRRLSGCDSSDARAAWRPGGLAAWRPGDHLTQLDR